MYKGKRALSGKVQVIALPERTLYIWRDGFFRIMLEVAN
jgi:hypothetical protein